MPRRSSKPTPTVDAFDAAIRLIAGRNHSRVELRRKLLRRGYDEAAIEAAEARLLEAGYLNDRMFAELYVRRRSRTLGPLALAAELTARGIDRELAENAVGRIAPQTQMMAAQRLADRLAGNTRYGSYRELLHSVGAKLLRRGFSMSIARAACDGLWDGTPDGAEA